jgi:hypothetical protein
MYAGCKKHNPAPVPVTDQQLDLLTKSTWKVTTVTLGSVPKTSDYPNFTLTITGTKGQTIFNFTTAGRPSLSPWPASGNFTFDADAPLTKLSRNDTPPVAIQYAATATNLTMSFSFAGNGYTNRVGNVTGDWVFTFGQ